MSEQDTSKSILSTYRFDGRSEGSIDRDALTAWLDQSLQAYIQLREKTDIDFFGFRSLDKIWEEMDLKYRGLPRRKRNKKYEYAGQSNIVTGEFHKTIDVMVDKWMQALFSGAQLFSVAPTSHSSYEDAHLARLLVKYSMDRVENFQTETRKAALASVLYGTCFVYAPWEVREKYRASELLYYTSDADGNPDQPSDEPELFEIYDEIKLTGFQNINPKRVLINPDVADIQEQEVVYIKQTVAWSELLEMEADGRIDKGMAERLLGEYVSDETVDDNRLRAFNIYIVFKRMQFEDGGKKLYEIIYAEKPQLILGLRPYLCERIPLLKSNFIPQDDNAYGISLGQIIYSTFTAMCGRLNQVFDAGSMQILGGGFYDSDLLSLGDIKKQEPGLYIGVQGLRQALASKSILSFRELSGAHPASIGLDVMAILTRAIQDGSGITNTASGMPTNTQADKTFRGMELLAQEADTRIGASLAIFESEVNKKYAEFAYDNYMRFLDPAEDLPKMFDLEQLTFVDSNGQQRQVRFGENLRDVEFVFDAAIRIVDRDIKIGKMQRFLQAMGMIGQMQQALISLGIDPRYFAQEIAKQLDFVDLDVMMPPNMSPQARLQQVMQQMRQIQVFAEAQQKILALTREKLQQGNDRLGLIALEQAADEVNRQMQEVKNGRG
jgi:hypothetical protein